MKALIKVCLAALFATAVFPISLKADGTLYLSDIAPLLAQQPKLWSALKEGFDLRDVGMASRINVKMNKVLDGRRIAPYIFDAKPKDSNAMYIFTVEIRAKTHYYDAKGKEVVIAKAVNVKEEFDSIVIRKRSETDIKIDAEFENFKEK